MTIWWGEDTVRVGLCRQGQFILYSICLVGHHWARGQEFLLISVSASVCLVGPESFEVSDMAAVFTSRLKVNISELLLDELPNSGYNPEHPELHELSERLRAWITYPTNCKTTFLIHSYQSWFTGWYAADIFFTDSKWGKILNGPIEAGQNSPGLLSEADEEKPNVSKDEWNQSSGRCDQPSRFW